MDTPSPQVLPPPERRHASERLVRDAVLELTGATSSRQHLLRVAAGRLRELFHCQQASIAFHPHRGTALTAQAPTNSPGEPAECSVISERASNQPANRHDRLPIHSERQGQSGTVIEVCHDRACHSVRARKGADAKDGSLLLHLCRPSPWDALAEERLAFFAELLAPHLDNLESIEMGLRYKTIFERYPTGTVVINPHDESGNWTVEECNAAFCDMNGYEPSELIGEDILKLSNQTAFDCAPRDEYYRQLKAHPSIRSKDIHRRKGGSEFPIELMSCLLLLDGQERVLGVDWDISEQVRITTVLKDLQHDIGRTFHTLTATLQQVAYALRPTILALGREREPAGRANASADAAAETTAKRSHCTSALKKLVECLEPQEPEDDPAPDRPHASDRILLAIAKLEKIDHFAAIECQPAAVRIVAGEVLSVLDSLKGYSIRNEVLREARRSTEILERSMCCRALEAALDTVIDTDALVRDMRERVQTDMDNTDQLSSNLVSDMLRDTIEGLAELAAHKGIEIRNTYLAGDAKVYVVRRDLVRCINNLLHNAIKYSWFRKPGSPSYINIRTIVTDRTVSTASLPGLKTIRVVQLEIEDYGVPIVAAEISRGLIYKFGYRGQLSSQRGRIGTGVGLHDAREVALRFRGDLTLESRPANRDADPSDTSVPHIKTARLWIPLEEAT